MDENYLARLARATGDDDPLEALAAYSQVRQEMRRVEAVLVRRARNAGATWAGIAEVLGVSKQAVHQKFGGRRFGRSRS